MDMNKNHSNDNISEIVNTAKQLFLNKMKDYGPSWLILRESSLTDQILIKAKRIKQIEILNGNVRISENEYDEYIGIINYCVMALMRCWFAESISNDSKEIFSMKSFEIDRFDNLYDDVILRVLKLMDDKNHDYGDAWKELRITSITDFILVKLYRVKQLEDNEDGPIVSEGIDAQYADILNYSVFALLKLR